MPPTMFRPSAPASPVVAPRKAIFCPAVQSEPLPAAELDDDVDPQAVSARPAAASAARLRMVCLVPKISSVRALPRGAARARLGQGSTLAGGHSSRTTGNGRFATKRWPGATGPTDTSGAGHAVLHDALGDLAHRAAQVHRRLLDPAERLRLAQAQLALEDPLGPVDGLAGRELLAEVGDLALQGAQLGEPADRDLDRGHQVGTGERLDQVGHRPGVAGTVDQLALGE